MEIHEPLIESVLAVMVWLIAALFGIAAWGRGEWLHRKGRR
jgi:hypothetical protein